MNKILPFLVVITLGGCALANRQSLRIDSIPPDALVSLHQPDNPSCTPATLATPATPTASGQLAWSAVAGAAGCVRKVAGSTPVEKTLDLPSNGHLSLDIEKRGYVPQTVEVTPNATTLSVTLERMKDANGQDVKEYALPPISRLLLPAPDFQVIKRGVGSDTVSADDSSKASQALATDTATYFSGRFDVVIIPLSPDDMHLLNSVWRDARTAMELVDPIRLKYLPTPQYLETKSARDAAHQLGSRSQAEALLLLSGKQNVETAGLVLAKLGMSAAGTMASFGTAYGNAVARGDSWFVYTVYTPSFAQGTLLKAVLIDCGTGEILWVNKGVWGTVSLNDPKWAADLFSGLK